MALPLYRATQKLSERIEDMKNHLSSGSVPSWELYQKKSGILQGLREALEVIKEAEESYLNDED